MTGKPQYLLRFDDLCPTMNWRAWSDVESALVQRNVKPLLAVVPDNQDPQLQVDQPVPDFWDRVRAWQARGWTIAMHGYQHKYVTRERGIVGINRFSEFAGLSAAEQEGKLRKGHDILRHEGIEASVFVAPGHSFDRTTVSLLPRFGLRTISDGFSRYPFRSREGVFWIPQQLWDFAPQRSGVWTVCIHHNAWQAEDVARFSHSLELYKNVVVSLDAIAQQYANRQPGLRDQLFAWYWRRCRRIVNGGARRLLKTVRHRSGFGLRP
jgi:predicted deacetylase